MSYYLFLLLVFCIYLPVSRSCTIPTDWDPNSPSDILCCKLPEHLVHCVLEEETCLSWMTTYESSPFFGEATCIISSNVPCSGPRTFKKEVPCIKTNGKRYQTLALLSSLCGIFGADRFYLGQYTVATFKLLTIGGLGVWWLIDMILLVNNGICPNNNCIWEPLW
ncbi:hypothetical protein RCL1_000358 [Eukaryota sp. TZLM3-RCL]